MPMMLKGKTCILLCYVIEIHFTFNLIVPAETRISSHHRSGRSDRSGRTMKENRLMTRTLNHDFQEYYLDDNKEIQVNKISRK
jgi:hypothetical protein